MSRADVPVHGMVLSLQRAVLDRLYSPVVLSRIIDSQFTVPSASEEFAPACSADDTALCVWPGATAGDAMARKCLWCYEPATNGR